MLLPSEYQEVEYIQSSGTQYIDTGLYANQNTIVETKWNLVQYNSNAYFDKIYGTYGSNGSNCFFLQSNRPEDYKIRTVNYSNNSNTYKINSSSAITTGTDYTVKHSATEFWLNGVLQGSCNTISYTSPTTITIFALHDGSSVTQNVYLKLYSFKMYDGQTLTRDFVPCYRKSDDVVGLYDLVNDVFYTNQGTGTFSKGPDFKGGKISKGYLWVREPKIPTEYQEVEYIEQTGTQYIDIGVTPTEKTMSRIKFMNLEVTGDIIYGYNPNNDTADYRFFNYSGANYFDLPGGSGAGNRIQGGTCSTNTIYEYEVGNFYVKDLVSGSNVISGTAIGAFTGTRSITLGWSYANNNSSKNRWYYVQVFEGSEMVRWMIPCYRKSDNVIGMYDKIEGQFYTNQGTGTFSKGNDVDPTYEFKEKQFYPGTPPTPTTLFEIETDFRNYSNISDVYALGWGAQAKGSMSPAVNSTYGFYCGNYTSYRGGRWLYYDISSYMANAKKIYAHLTGYMPGGYTYQANERIVLCNISRIDGNGETTASDVFATELKGGNYNGNTNIGKAVGGASYTKLVDYGSSNYTGNVDIAFEINLESGLVTSVITQPSLISMQYTLSASEISWIKSTLKFIDFAFTTYATGINNYITTAHIKIE